MTNSGAGVVVLVGTVGVLLANSCWPLVMPVEVPPVDRRCLPVVAVGELGASTLRSRATSPTPLVVGWSAPVIRSKLLSVVASPSNELGGTWLPVAEKLHWGTAPSIWPLDQPDAWPGWALVDDLLELAAWLAVVPGADDEAA